MMMGRESWPHPLWWSVLVEAWDYNPSTPQAHIQGFELTHPNIDSTCDLLE